MPNDMQRRIEPMQTVYLSAAETAKLIRAALKRQFPTTKFSIRSHNYSMGSSIYVSWTDGPAFAAVDAITSSYQGARFDGSIDMAYSVKHWLLPDGSMHIASDPGTTGSAGSHPPERHWMPDPAARLVHCRSYVSCTREISPPLRERVASWLSRRDWRFLNAYGMWRQCYDEAEAIDGIAQLATIHDGALVIARKR